MVFEGYTKVGDNGIGGLIETNDQWTAAHHIELEKRINDAFKKYTEALKGNGVLSGLAVSQKGAGANQSVDVAAGLCIINGREYTEASTVNVPLDAAHATYARWDLIVYRAGSSDPVKITGTEGQIPTIPDMASGDISLALILREANDNVVENADIIDKRIMLPVTDALTATIFQVNPATGTCTNPEYLNDTLIVASSVFDAINEYGEFDLGGVYKFSQYRIFGAAAHNGTGRWKLQYYLDGIWTDWLTDIPTRTTADWSNWITVSDVNSTKIRLVATTLDTGAGNINYCNEIEVKW